MPKHVKADSPLGIKGIYLKAREIEDRGLQETFLDRACGGDSQLRSQVEKMLAAGRLDRSPVEVVAGKLGLPCEETSADPEADAALTSDVDTGIAWLSGDSELDVSAHPLIDSYKLLEQIGQGGMGSVYMAQQTAPVKRKVALKVIKAGMDSKEVIARFEAERQALAMMDHPHIAKVLDGGTTDTGRPYFVMELVRGVPITEFCNGKKLGLRERIELFIDVCKAVQHAHQKGVIHRDLKPSNLLVTMHDDKAVVKVIDFGVAKALNQELTERTLFTQFSQMIGTPLYMAPEQAQMSGLDIDTRSDIYSLGVVLYELLTGTTPFDRETMSKLGMDGIRKLLNEQEPLRPSVRISTLRAANQSTIEDNRRIDVPELSKQLRRELDWIVMKALEKDRERRYESANAFAADVQRYLNDEPVEACPPSVAYRVRKLVRRNRVLVLTTAAVAAALVLGIIGTSWQAILASQDRRRALAAEDAATREAAVAQAVNEFMREDLLGKANPKNEADRDIRLRDVLDRAATTVGARFDKQPLVEAAIRQTLGETYLGLGLYEEAQNHLQRAWQIYKLQLGEDDLKSLEAGRQLANVFNAQRRESEAEALARRLGKLANRRWGRDHPTSLKIAQLLAIALAQQNRFREAETLLISVAAAQQRVFGPEHEATLAVLSNLAGVKIRLGKSDDAEKILFDLLSIQQNILGEDHPGTISTIEILAVCVVDHDLPRAERLLRQALNLRIRVLGAQHPSTLGTMQNLARATLGLGKAAETERILRQALEISQSAFEEPHQISLKATTGLADFLLTQRRADEAELLFRDALKVALQLNGPEQAEVLGIRSGLARALGDQGRKSEAESLNRKLLEVAKRVLGEDDHVTLLITQNLADSIPSNRKTDERRRLQRIVFNAQRDKLGNGNPKTVIAANDLVLTLNDQHLYADAAQIAREIYDAAEQSLGENDSMILAIRHNLGVALNGQSLYDEADQIFEDVLSEYRESRGEQHPETVAAERLVSNAWTNRTWKLAVGRNSEQSDLAQAVNFGRLSVELQRDSDRCWNNFGVALFRAGQYQEAVEAFEKADAMIEGGDREHRMFFAMAQWELGNKHDAERLYTQGSAWISTPGSWSQEQQRFREEAEQLMGISEEERKERIVKYYDRLETNDMQLRTERGKWYLANGERAKASVDFTAVLEQEPESQNVDLWRCRGTAQMQAQRYEDAVADFSRALQLKPDHLDSLTQRGRAYLILEQFELALVDLDRAVTIKPSVGRHNYRGKAQRGLGNFQAALADLAKVIELDPDNSAKWSRRQDAHVLRGDIYALDLNQHQMAVREYSQAVELDPENSSFIEKLQESMTAAELETQATESTDPPIGPANAAGPK